MEKSTEVLLKTKNRATIWPSNPTSGHIPWENCNSKRHMHPSVHHQSILKEINPEYSLEGLMLKLKLQNFGHLMWRANSLERPWCWGKLKAEGEGDVRGWDGWMASPNQWTSTWANSRRSWGTGKPCKLQSMGSQMVGCDLANEQQQKAIFCHPACLTSMQSTLYCSCWELLLLLSRFSRVRLCAIP